jgi:alpha-D-xyloside xylohydrolase
VTYGQDTFNIFTNTGGSNEVWSFGERVEGVLTELLALRERLRPYLSEAFATYARTGDPVMAPLFYRFPDQPDLYDRGDAYMFGPDLLVAPVLEPGAEARDVALPAGETWVDAWTGAEHAGGSVAHVAAPWGRIPVFIRKARADALGPIFVPPDH